MAPLPPTRIAMSEWHPPYAFGANATAQMERLLDDMGRIYRERNAALLELEHAHHEALLRLAVAAELRDGDTGSHIARIGYLAEALARRLGVPQELARLLRMAAPMHDIGKIGVEDHVLKKAGPLTPQERQSMERHPQMGADILGHSDEPLFALAAEVALHHHERWDGSGYPQGLRGDAIPLSGRIVAVLDFFDALTMERCYRPALPDPEAIGMLAAAAGSHFDPDIVACFERHATELIELRDWVNHSKPGLAALANRRPTAPAATPTVRRDLLRDIELLKD